MHATCTNHRFTFHNTYTSTSHNPPHCTKHMHSYTQHQRKPHKSQSHPQETKKQSPISTPDLLSVWASLICHCASTCWQYITARPPVGSMLLCVRLSAIRYCASAATDLLPSATDLLLQASNPTRVSLLLKFWWLIWLLYSKLTFRIWFCNYVFLNVSNKIKKIQTQSYLNSIWFFKFKLHSN